VIQKKSVLFWAYKSIVQAKIASFLSHILHALVKGLRRLISGFGRICNLAATNEYS